MNKQEIKAYNAGYDDAVKDFSMWHPASELRECFDDCFKNEDGTYHGDYVEWLGLVSLCEGIESDGKHECRVVFCFDN